MEYNFGITPASEIYLLNVSELSPDYSNTYYFETPKEQTTFFQSKKPSHIEPLKQYTYQRKDSTLRVNIHIDNLHSVNYVMYKNQHSKWYYAFILNKIYINERVTEIVLATDLIQTYLFDFKLDTSYVERCHVNRWSSGRPTREYEEEGLELGEYIQVDQKVIKTYNNSFVAVCSNPLGQLVNRRIDSGGGGTPSGNWLQGRISGQGFRFIKGFEGFACQPYDDGAGYMTIGYGTAQKFNPTEYNQLYNGGRGCTEEQAAKVFNDKLYKSYTKDLTENLKAIGITKQYQADAFYSIAYNCGPADAKKLMADIKGNINNRPFVENIWHNFRIRPDMPSLTEGLKRRRRNECKMFFGDKPEMNAILKIGCGGGVVKDNNGDGWMPN